MNRAGHHHRRPSAAHHAAEHAAAAPPLHRRPPALGAPLHRSEVGHLDLGDPASHLICGQPSSEKSPSSSRQLVRSPLEAPPRCRTSCREPARSPPSSSGPAGCGLRRRRPLAAARSGRAPSMARAIITSIRVKPAVVAPALMIGSFLISSPVALRRMCSSTSTCRARTRRALSCRAPGCESSSPSPVATRTTPSRPLPSGKKLMLTSPL